MNPAPPVTRVSMAETLPATPAAAGSRRCTRTLGRMELLPARRALAIAAAVAMALAVALTGCARDEFEDRTAVVSVGGSRQTYEVDACGLDGQTIFLVARADDGAIVQGVVGLEDDDQTGVPESTGVTVDLDPRSEDTRVAAFGAESWERRGSVGPPPGSISSARLRGSRIQFSGEVVPVDAKDVPLPDGAPQRFTVDARCDEVD